MERINKHQYYLNIAETVAQRSTCLNKHWGAVIVKDDVIISTGFNGAPRHLKDCMEKGFCPLLEYRRKNNLGRGTAYEYCLSTHAEQNAIIFGDKHKMDGATLYLCGKELNGMDGIWNYVQNPNPCPQCKKMIINTGIDTVILRIDKNHATNIEVNTWTENDIVGGY